MKRFPLLALAFLALLLGCGEDQVTIPLPPGVSTVVGTVERVDDAVPVDGGVTIQVLKDRSQERVNLLFPSMFTVEGPSQEQVDLYVKLRDIQVGYRVRAFGRWNGDDLDLDDIVVLSTR